jgi:hypothetical protein
METSYHSSHSSFEDLTALLESKNSTFVQQTSLLALNIRSIQNPPPKPPPNLLQTLREIFQKTTTIASDLNSMLFYLQVRASAELELNISKRVPFAIQESQNQIQTYKEELDEMAFYVTNKNLKIKF